MRTISAGEGADTERRGGAVPTRAALPFLLLTGLLSAGACGEEGPTVPAAIERPILYQSGGRIIAVDTTGADDAVLVDDQAEHVIHRAYWSPTGTHLLTAERERAPGSKLEAVVRAADGSMRVLVSDPAREPDDWPIWSPDGSRVAYTSRSQLFVVNRDGTNHVQVNADSAYAIDPHWSPQGDWIVYLGQVDGEIGVVRVRPDGAGRQMVRVTGPNTASHPRFSPDGRRIAFVESNAIWVMNADGTGLTAITSTPSEGDDSPRWSPDGRYLAHDTDAGSYWGVAVVDVASGVRTDLFSHASMDVRYAAWAPDSRRLAFDPEIGIGIGILGADQEWVGAGPGSRPDWHPGR